jgi:alpha-D-ribose 1-methylphosphonate 5-triphosphate diphosphatase
MAADFVIDNANIVTPEGVLADASLSIEEGRIAQIQMGTSGRIGFRIDARDGIIMPGFVDIHSDAIEKWIEPRPGGRFPVDIALQELDKHLVSCGITTIFHCVSLTDSDVASLRAPERAADIARTINRSTAGLKARTHVHARYDVTETDCVPLIERLIRDGQMHLFSLMDHTPGQGQFSDVDHFKAYYGGVRGCSQGKLDDLIRRRLQARERLDDVHIRHLTALCRERNIHLASHDDDSREKVERLHRLGVSLSEFPVNLEAARVATKLGMHVSLGAPNVLRGSSLTGNLSGRQAIEAGCCDILCSDYSPMSLLHAGMTLHRCGIRSLHEVANMLSLHPAEAVGIADETGSIEEGKAADLVWIEFTEDVPCVTKTFVQGREVFSTC